MTQNFSKLPAQAQWVRIRVQLMGTGRRVLGVPMAEIHSGQRGVLHCGAREFTVRIPRRMLVVPEMMRAVKQVRGIKGRLHGRVVNLAEDDGVFVLCCHGRAALGHGGAA